MSDPALGFNVLIRAFLKNIAGMAIFFLYAPLYFIEGRVLCRSEPNGDVLELTGAQWRLR